MRRNRADKQHNISIDKAQKQKDKQSPEYETMSQRQNRHGKGRERNGSDGGSNIGRGSNH
ncbi:MAG: hypothetical protein ACM3VS_09815 [Candidatus Dadabacteria bacterium]